MNVTFQFLIRAIIVFLGDMPQHDLMLMDHIYYSKKSKKVKELIKTNVSELNNKVRTFYLNLNPDETLLKLYKSEILNAEEKKQAEEIICSVLSIKTDYLAWIDQARTKILEQAPETRLALDILLYYKNRVIQFFDELEKEAQNFGIWIENKVIDKKPDSSTGKSS